MWPYTSKGIKDTTGQSWKVWIYLIKVELSTLTCPIFDAPWSKGHMVPHCKALRYGEHGLRERCGTIFSIC